MTWQQASHEAAFTAKDFLFADGRRTDLRLAYRTLGELAPNKVAVTMNIGPLVLTNIGPPPGV